MTWIDGRFEENVITTTLEQAMNWAKQSSVWPMTFGLACCAIEMMAIGASRFDLDRFGAGAFRATPRQADLMIVAGTVTYKMASRLRRLYEQMPDPEIRDRDGCLHGGRRTVLQVRLSRLVKGVDLVVPVDVYVPGCPPPGRRRALRRHHEDSRQDSGAEDYERISQRPAGAPPQWLCNRH